jgi:signal transduction histidine kinase
MPSRPLDPREIARALGIDEAEVERRKDFLGLDEAALAVLGRLHDRLGEAPPGFVEQFHDFARRFDELRPLLADPDVAARVRARQAEYFASLTACAYGREYALDRLAVGLAHRRAGLEPKWYVGAYARYLDFMLPHVLEAMDGDRGRTLEALRALVKVVLLDMGLAIDTYIFVEKEALREHEERLRQAQKMEAIGRLAGGVAHDFNNLLTAIVGHGELLLRRLGEDPLAHEVAEIHEAALRAASLTKQLLAFSRRQVLEPHVIDLNEVVGGVERMLRRLIGENIELALRPAAALGSVRADPGQIEQVVMNLVLNARDAMRAGGRITIETANADLAGGEPGGRAGLPAGRYVVVAVSDTGCGMDRETLSHLFEPYFTTKALGRGTGLGLATAYGIVRQSGGDIFVYSEPGRGTTVKVYLPRVDAPPEPLPEPASLVADARGGTETVLLVEDEEAVRHLARAVLERSGYRVLEARDGAEALALAGAHGGPVHLVLTDVVLPGMSGPEVAAGVAALRPGVRPLYMSGYTEGALLNQAMVNGEAPLLDKPFSPATLVRKVREVLDR